MAWFHKSLKEMEEAVKQENWPEVKRILDQHIRSSNKESSGMTHHISDIPTTISHYNEDLSQIFILLEKQMRGGKHKDDLLIKVQSAVNNAYKFEEVLMQLIKKGKFME